MKIAFVEWWPRICGVTEVALHWVAGAAPLGYQADLVTFSKTGKPAKDWITRGAWKVHRVADLVEVLDTYDLVILTDLICQAPKICGGRTKKNWVKPYFVDALKPLRTPWTTMLHDGAYHAKHDETIREMLALPSFAGSIITSRPKAVGSRFAEFGLGDKWKMIYYPYLPYNAAALKPFVGPRTREFIMTSRIGTPKGQNTALELLKDLHGDVHVWGVCAFGLPSLAWSMLWEFGLALGYKPMKPPGLARRTPNLTHPNAHKFYTGTFELRAGKRRYVYHDEFDSQDTLDWSPWVSLSLTNDRLHESLEVMTLDAIAKGAVAVVPEKQFQGSARYEHLITVPYEGASWRVKDGAVTQTRADWDRPRIVARLNDVLTWSERKLKATAAAQRQEVLEKHDPAKVLKHLLKEL